MSCTDCVDRETNREFTKVWCVLLAGAIVLNLISDELSKIRKTQQRMQDSLGLAHEKLYDIEHGLEAKTMPGRKFTIDEEVESNG